MFSTNLKLGSPLKNAHLKPHPIVQWGFFRQTGSPMGFDTSIVLHGQYEGWYNKYHDWLDLVVYLPLWKIWKSVGMIIPNIIWKIKNVPNHQPVLWLPCGYTREHWIHLDSHSSATLSSPKLGSWSHVKNGPLCMALHGPILDLDFGLGLFRLGPFGRPF